MKSHFKVLSRFRTNPFDSNLRFSLGNSYLESTLSSKHLDFSSKYLLEQHESKNDSGTFQYIEFLSKKYGTNESNQSYLETKIFETYLSRTDSNDPKILFKISIGHLFNYFGSNSNYDEGIKYLEESISHGRRKGIPLLIECKLKERFGFELSLEDIFLQTHYHRYSSNRKDRIYYGICLIVGIGTKIDLYDGWFYFDLSYSFESREWEYFNNLLSEPNNPHQIRPYSIFDDYLDFD
jgi:hypothetical protein